MRRLSRPVLAAGLVAAVFVGLVARQPATASTPMSGTLTSRVGEVAWSGDQNPAQTAGFQGLGCPAGAADPTCDRFDLTIDPSVATQRANDVQIAMLAQTSSLNDFDLYVYDAAGTEVGRSVTIGQSETLVLTDPAPGAYAVYVQTALSIDPAATYDAVARTVALRSQAPIDEETPCGIEGEPTGLGPIVGDPRPALDSFDRGQRVSLDVALLLDGVSVQQARALFDKAAASYAPLGIDLRIASTRPHRFASDEALAIVAEAKEVFGGERPKGADIVEVLTATDIQQLGQRAIAGLADCIGGVAHPDRAFLVAEAFSPEDIAIGPAVFDANARANVTAHEIGHLMGGQHHYANCVEGVQTSDVRDDGKVEVSPCTLMFNAADFLGVNFGTANGAVTRGHAVQYAQP